MTTEIEIDNRRKRCPVCDTLVNELGLAKAGLTKEELLILQRRKDDGTLGSLIHLADTLMGKNSSHMRNEADTKRAIAEFNATAAEVRGDVAELLKRLAGTAVGKIGESIIIKELKSLCPTDEFSAEKADKHGTDIVAKVMEGDSILGTVAISVKYVTQWKGEIMTQMHKNMRQERTPFGLLVTKVFPNDALNDKAYATPTKAGKMLLLVKPEYASVAYYGFRQAVIAWEQANTMIKEEQERIREHQRIAKAVIEWISGPRFREIAQNIDDAIDASEDRTHKLENLKTYAVQKIDVVLQSEEEGRGTLRNAKSALQGLKDLLDGKKEEGQ